MNEIELMGLRGQKKNDHCSKEHKLMLAHAYLYGEGTFEK